jgi:transposase
VKAAGTRGAYLVFIDEAGFLLEPLVRRTYAPRGHTPVQRVADKHGRISAVGAIVVSPRHDHIALQYGLLADNVNFRGPTLVQFLRTLHAGLAAPMTVFWDQIPIHNCSAVDEYLAMAPDLVIEPFPPYAPELNPADGIWRYTKYGRLANYCPADLFALRSRITTELDRLQGQSELLTSFVRFTELPLEV